MKLTSMVFALLALSGCLSSGSTDDVEPDAGTTSVLFDDGSLFALNGCEGSEFAFEWVGPHGSEGPRDPPAAWRYQLAENDFTWSMEALQCNRIGWGPLERGPVSVVLEFHNAYLPPEACLVGLGEPSFVRFIHYVYWDDMDVLQFGRTMGMPVLPVNLTWQAGPLDSLRLHMTVEESKNSTVEMVRPGAYESDAANIKVAFFWFDAEHVHRLTLQRETGVTQGDTALLNMAPPSIMGGWPGPAPALANWLSNLHWTGNLVTFSDPECTTQVFP